VLQEINQAVEQVSQMISHIASASEEQAEGIHQVHQAINQIDEVTQQNAALVEETSAAAESMSEQARDLGQNMAFFKISQSAQAHSNAAVLTSQTPKTLSPGLVKAVMPTLNVKTPSIRPNPIAVTAKSVTPALGNEWNDF
jgi:methyl-accepting chemotaxis protein